jgi:hypothetical protein
MTKKERKRKLKLDAQLLCPDFHPDPIPAPTDHKFYAISNSAF